MDSDEDWSPLPKKKPSKQQVKPTHKVQETDKENLERAQQKIAMMQKQLQRVKAKNGNEEDENDDELGLESEDDDDLGSLSLIKHLPPDKEPLKTPLQCINFLHINKNTASLHQSTAMS
ncbi:hypothetical protein C0995_008607 [Termitomyces sp. Mi166|nr:hypothetical protein C0995_008607 [Termitomyces sp. Mi166\